MDTITERRIRVLLTIIRGRLGEIERLLKPTEANEKQSAPAPRSRNGRSPPRHIKWRELP